MDNVTQTDKPANIHTNESDRAQLLAIFNRLSKLPTYVQPWDECIKDWGPMTLEDWDDLITHREGMQRIHDGTEPIRLTSYVNASGSKDVSFDRILYEIDDTLQTVTITSVEDRKEVYR